MTEEQKNKCEIIINFYEEKYKKDLNELFYNFHEEYVPWALLFHYGDTDTVFYWYNPISMLFGNFVPLSFTLSQMEGVEDKFFELLGNSKDKAAENIIDIAVSISEVFNKNITKTEAEKLLFIKNDIEKEDMEAGIPAGLGNFCVFTREFGKVIEEYESEDKYYIKSVCWAIANYFDNNKENNNNQKEENKNFNNENKINNVVENTAKEKIMQPKEQRIKCKEIINSYKAQIGNINFIVPNSIISLNASLNVSKNSPNITLFTIPEYISIITSMTISLAKVFNKDITKKELEKIILDLKEDLKENPDSEKYKDFESMCWTIVEKLDDELKLNLLILGKTGTGKSSLVNALVGKKVAKVGGIKPETPYGIFEYKTEIDGKKVNIYDSWGIERNEDAAKKWKELIKDELRKRGVDKDIKDWFHSITYCTHVGVDRLEPFEKEIIKELLKEKYEVVIAITKADRIITPEEKKEYDKYIEDIKKITGVNRVVKVAVNPVKSIIMTETPKPFGLPEYKAAILVSWEKIFIDRIPLHIIEKLKENIKNEKYNAPKRKPKDDDDLKNLAEEIDEYFINIINKKLPIHIKESFEKYNKITENIITINTNIDISNFYSRKNIDPNTYIYDLHGFNLLRIFDHLKDLVIYLQVKSDIDKYINNFIDKRVEEAIKYISEKSFEDKIRKIITDNLEK